MAMNHFRVAIVGGGLAGATLANALVRLSQMDVHIFESAAEFSERGAAVGLRINAQVTLNEIIFAPAAVDLLDKAGGVPTNTSRIVLVKLSKSITFNMMSKANTSRVLDLKRAL
jgi:salicylate hydroxylase